MGVRRIWHRQIADRAAVRLPPQPLPVAEQPGLDAPSCEAEQARADRTRLVVFGASHEATERPRAAATNADTPIATRASQRNLTTTEVEINVATTDVATG